MGMDDGDGYFMVGVFRGLAVGTQIVKQAH